MSRDRENRFPSVLRGSLSRRDSLLVLSAGIAACFLAGVSAARATHTGPPAAQNLPRPTGTIVLSVNGQISNTNAPGRADFDRAMLEALGISSIEATSPWSDGRRKFQGVLARDVMLAVGAQGQLITATGQDDYSVDIPASDFMRYPVLLALQMDGKYLQLRNQGPVLIVYPRDDYTELATPTLTRKSVGMLREITVR
jgi:hypothetical protein